MSFMSHEAMRICRICLAPEGRNGRFTKFFDETFNFLYQLNYTYNISVSQNYYFLKIINQKIKKFIDLRK